MPGAPSCIQPNSDGLHRLGLSREFRLERESLSPLTGSGAGGATANGLPGRAEWSQRKSAEERNQSKEVANPTLKLIASNLTMASNLRAMASKPNRKESIKRSVFCECLFSFVL